MLLIKKLSLQPAATTSLGVNKTGRKLYSKKQLARKLAGDRQLCSNYLIIEGRVLFFSYTR